MKLDLTDPQSIAAWYRINPPRHAEFLRHCLSSEAWARFWPAIAASRELVK
jgi:hypothetical protein